MRAEAVGHQARVTVRFLAVMSVGLFAVAGVVVWSELREPDVWDPLGDYPVQEVTSRVEGIDGPAAHVDGTVDVTATKCNDTREAVEVRTELAWRSVSPRGASWVRGASLNERPPGCDALRFQNVVPPEVQILVAAQHAAGVEAPVWSIVGVETPVRDHGTDGRPARWQTENFTLVP